jgi:hypothetical protein
VIHLAYVFVKAFATAIIYPVLKSLPWTIKVPSCLYLQFDLSFSYISTFSSNKTQPGTQTTFLTKYNMDVFISTMNNTPKPNFDPSSPEFQLACEEKRHELKENGLEGDELEAEMQRWIDNQKASRSTPDPSSSSKKERNRLAYEEKLRKLTTKGVTGEELEAEMMDTDHFRELEAFVNTDFERVIAGQFQKTSGDDFVLWTRN